VIVEVLARVDLLASVGEVRILAVLLRTAAGEMLGHARDGPGAEFASLESANVGAHQLAGEIGIFSERAVDPRPPGFGSEIGHRVQSAANADRHVLLPGDIAESLNQRRISRGSESERFGPLRE